MKPVHLPVTGHDLLAVERFRDDTRHMIEFLVLSGGCPLGESGQYIRRFLSEDGYHFHVLCEQGGCGRHL